MWPLFKLSPGPLLKSCLARYCTRQETISGRPEQVYLPFDQDWNELERGPLFELDTNKRQRDRMRPPFKLSFGQLLKSGLRPIFRYCTHQETISRRPEQKYLPSDPRSEWPAGGGLFKPACFRKFQIAYLDR